MSARLQELERICKMMEHERPPLARPFTIEIDRGLWTIGSDGHGLLAFHDLPEVPWPSVSDTAPDFHKVIRDHRPDVAGAPVDLVALKEWCADAALIERANCRECHGDGIVTCEECKGDGRGCDFCGHIGTLECEACNYTPFKPGLLGTFRLNRGVLWKWLSWVRPPIGATLWIPPQAGTSPGRPALFRGDDWFLLVMPLRHFPEDTFPNDPVFPWADPAVAVGR